jgi:hypothetical protein
MRAAHARVIAQAHFDWLPSMFIQFQVLYDLRLCLLYTSFRTSVSIIFGVNTIEPLYAVENDPEYMIAPQIPG